MSNSKAVRRVPKTRARYTYLYAARGSPSPSIICLDFNAPARRIICIAAMTLICNLKYTRLKFACPNRPLSLYDGMRLAFGRRGGDLKVDGYIADFMCRAITG